MKTRDDVTPGPNPTAKKKMGDHYDNAGSPPNNPTKNKQPTSYNTTADYCSDTDDPGGYDADNDND